MQCHNYISEVYNKPNRLKIGWKLSKLLFKKYMYHYQHNVMGERADCGKMAAMCAMVDGRRLAFLGAAPGVNPLLSAIYRRGVWKGTNASRPKIRFFLAWEIGCVVWERVKTCKSVCHTAKPWELAALSLVCNIQRLYRNPVCLPSLIW